MLNGSIRPIDRTLSGATTLGQNEPGNNGNVGVLHVSQISNAGAAPLDGLVPYPGRGTFPSDETQSLYSTAPADWAIQ